MDSSILEKIEELRKVFDANRNKEDAHHMEAYMKNHFKMYGIKATPRRQLSKFFIDYCKSYPQSFKVEIARILHGYPERELHHVAQELLGKGYKRNIAVDDIHWITEFITTNSWWDSVDFVAPQLAGAYFLKYPEKRQEICDEWINSDNIWLIRSAILFQLKYKERTDLDFLFTIILKTCHIKEFFINKAIGWILRDNSRRIPEEIKAFVKAHGEKLSPLSKKEALRLLK